ncbi:MAG: glycoside hydrolase 43 family protein [Chitinispirillaceae bacterium]|nr:glycoside hydrolase 43 family protein [Chitinispirillaceae bacterium]
MKIKIPAMAIVGCALPLAVLHAQPLNMMGPWIPDLGNGSYKNPIIHADYSDPDLIRVGSDYYMTSSSFNCTPGLQILHSRDLVNWRIIGKVFDQQVPVDSFTVPKPANGVWAPSIRHHDSAFYITYGDPDFGVYMARADKAEGPWMLKLIKSTKGWIDVCPFWDSNGQGYIVHAYANSRIGFKSILTIRKLSADNSQISDSIMVIDGNTTSPELLVTIEGPKLYKRGNYYYILAPAGGVTNGWQMALRATSINGPWEYKKVMERGGTLINGPHQGGWVTTPDEKQSWFIHFQDKGVYGRVVHLQPMAWVNDWPVIGTDANSDGCGNPVVTYTKPAVGQTSPIETPQTSDNFGSDTLGLQWQWYANSKPDWLSLTTNKGFLRLNTVALPSAIPDYKLVPNLLLQKFPADSFSFATKLTAHLKAAGERAGVIVVGQTYSLLAVVKKADGLYLTNSATESSSDIKLSDSTLFLRIAVAGPSGSCKFEYSIDGNRYTQVGSLFPATAAKWIGAKIGIFATSPSGTSSTGYADFDWVNVDRYGSYITAIVPGNDDHGSVESSGFAMIKQGRISFELPKSTMVILSLYNVLGTKVKEIRQQGVIGDNSITVESTGLGSGMYLYDLRAKKSRLGKGVVAFSTSTK